MENDTGMMRSAIIRNIREWNNQIMMNITPVSAGVIPNINFEKSLHFLSLSGFLKEKITAGRSNNTSKIIKYQIDISKIFPEISKEMKIKFPVI